MRIPDLEAWAAFVATAEEGSMSGAARTLGVTRATVSKALARLEARVGAPLLHRSTRRLSLSPLGAETLEAARTALHAAQLLEESAGAGAAQPRGRVRLAVPLDFGQRHVAPLLTRFLAAHPGIAIDLHLDDARVDIVGSGFDLVVRIGMLDDSSLRARRLCAVRLLTVAAPAFLNRHGVPGRPEDLSGRPCLLYANQPDPRLWRFAGGRVVRVAGPLVANNGAALMPPLFAGLGAAQLPDFLVADALAQGRLVRILESSEAEPLSAHLISPPTPLRPARVQLLADHLAAALRE
ncbi:MAG: LysR family transcriptional regulator [Thermaurantiacus sp.]